MLKRSPPRPGETQPQTDTSALNCHPTCNHSKVINIKTEIEAKLPDEQITEQWTISWNEYPDTHRELSQCRRVI